jgi:phosphomannomutase
LSSLREQLTYQPRELQFGTSGRRGLVADLTQLEIYINVLAELRYLRTLPLADGGIRQGDEFYLAHDLRPSSTRLVDGRGGIFQAAGRAVSDAGLRPKNLGEIPTPALMLFATARSRGSIMVTGSHIPFDRNGYKLNTSRGELLKHHEEPINRAVRSLRDEIYAEPLESSAFDAHGLLMPAGHAAPPPADGAARSQYAARYIDFFPKAALAGKRILVYQHSAVGRDLLVEILRALGAEAVPAGRSETFVPIDTENIDAAQLAAIQSLVDADHGPLDAVVSLDGDSDRPLVLGVEEDRVRFFTGDLLGMIVAEYLGADSVVVSISCNDGIDRGPLAPLVEPKTRIGSPYLIAGMEAATARGRKQVCGWEANGGFLLGSNFTRNGHTLAALPTRDAVLPILCALAAAAERRVSLGDLFAALPPRFSRATLLKNFPREKALRIVARFSSPDAPSDLARYFTAQSGFAAVAAIDYTDGVRITFRNGEVAHFRPSGNADEFRCYAVADRPARADEIAQFVVAEPDGIFRQMERDV